jgi:HlyD family secretion protein
MISNWQWRCRLVAAAWLLMVGCADRRLDADTFQGVVEYEERDLAFEVTGRITAIAVHEGDQLAPQATIARLAPELERSALAARQSEVRAAAEQLDLLQAGSRPEDIRVLAARVDAARAAETLVRVTAERTRKLTAAQAAPQAALDEAEAQLQRAQADSRAAEESLRGGRRGARIQEVAAARDRLAAAQASSDMQRERVSRYELRALETGEVLEVHLRTGELAVPGLPVVTVADTAHPYADVFVPEAAIGGIAVGTRASARIDALAHELPGHVERMSRRTEFTPRYLFSPAERASLVVRVRVRLDDPKRELHAGVPAFVRIERGGQSDRQAAR